MLREENPYVPPRSTKDDSHLGGSTSCQSYVKLFSWFGALFGFGFWVALQLAISSLQHPKRSLDNQYFTVNYRIEWFELLLWSIAMSLLFATLGSIVGALMDTWNRHR